MAQHRRQNTLHGELHFFFVQIGFKLVLHIGHHHRQIDRFQFQVSPAQPAVGEQVLDQGVHPTGSGHDSVAVVLASVIEPGRVILQQRVGKSLQRAQRRAKIVGDGIGKGLQLLVDRLQLRRALNHPLFEVRVQFLDFLFRAFALGDVAEETSVHRGFLPRVASDGQFGPKIRSISAHNGQFDWSSQQTPHAGHQVFCQPVTVVLAQRRRNDQLVHFPSQRLRPAVAENFLRRRIPFMNPSFVINGKNRIERGFQYSAFARLAFAQRIFRSFSFGDVAGNLGSAYDPAGRILERRYAQRDIDSGGIFPQASRFIMLDPLAVFEFFENFRFLALQFGRDQQTDRTAYDLFSRVAEDSHRSRVPTQNGAFQGLADNRVPRRLHDCSQLVARCFRPFAFGHVAQYGQRVNLPFQLVSAHLHLQIKFGAGPAQAASRVMCGSGLAVRPAPYVFPNEFLLGRRDKFKHGRSHQFFRPAIAKQFQVSGIHHHMNSGFRHTNGIDRVVKNGLQLGLAFPQRLRRPFVLHNFCQERIVRGGQFRSAFLNPLFQLVARIGQFGGALLDSQLQIAMRCPQCLLSSLPLRDDRGNRHGRNTGHPHERLQKNE